MESIKYFFSYSRQNSEFVIMLATDLKQAGANVWLDQIDIAPGSRWDETIETALNESQGLIVILSNASVKSQNVMDEVSYAINQGKKIIPILVESCAVPFRLGRLQHIDFTGNYETAFQLLLKALQVSEVLPNRPAAYNYKPAENPVLNETITSSITNKKISIIPVAIGFAVFFVAAIIILLLVLRNNYDAEEMVSKGGLSQTTDTSQAHPALKDNAENEPVIDSIRTELKTNNREPETNNKEREDAPQRLSSIPPTQKPASNRPIEPASKEIPSVIRIDGNWVDINQPGNGLRMVQEGSLCRYSGWGTIASFGLRFQSTGNYTINGQNITGTYTATYENGSRSFGNCAGTVSADGSQITVTCTDNVWGTFVSTTVRQ